MHSATWSSRTAVVPSVPLPFVEDHVGDGSRIVEPMFTHPDLGFIHLHRRDKGRVVVLLTSRVVSDDHNVIALCTRSQREAA